MCKGVAGDEEEKRASSEADGAAQGAPARSREAIRRGARLGLRNGTLQIYVQAAPQTYLPQMVPKPTENSKNLEKTVKVDSSETHLRLILDSFWLI